MLPLYRSSLLAWSKLLARPRRCLLLIFWLRCSFKAYSFKAYVIWWFAKASAANDVDQRRPGSGVTWSLGNPGKRLKKSRLKSSHRIIFFCDVCENWKLHQSFFWTLKIWALRAAMWWTVVPSTKHGKCQTQWKPRNVWGLQALPWNHAWKGILREGKDTDSQSYYLIAPRYVNKSLL